MLQNGLSIPCPQAETLALYSQNLLPDEKHSTISQHVTSCLRCSGWLNWYRLQRASVRNPLDRGSDHLADLAKSLFMHSLYRPQTVLQSQLVFDSRHAVALGVRSLSGQNRRLLFNIAGGVEIDIEIVRSKAGLSLRGQVYAGRGKLHVGLYSDGYLKQSAYTNKLDEFYFQNLECTDTLQIGLEQGIAVLELPRDIFSS